MSRAEATAELARRVMGWTEEEKLDLLGFRWQIPEGGSLPSFRPTDKAIHAFRSPFQEYPQTWDPWSSIADAWELEDELPGNLRRAYCNFLWTLSVEGKVDNDDLRFYQVHATAAQRTLAVCRTLGIEVNDVG